MRFRLLAPRLAVLALAPLALAACDGSDDATPASFVSARAGTYVGSVYATPPGTTAEQNFGPFTVTLADQGNG